MLDFLGDSFLCYFGWYFGYRQTIEVLFSELFAGLELFIPLNEVRLIGRAVSIGLLG